MSLEQPNPDADGPGDPDPGSGTDEWLRSCAESFRQSFADVPIGVALVGLREPAAGSVLHANRVMCQYLGRRADEVIGASYRQLVHPDDLSGFDRLFAKLSIRELDHWDGEHRYPHPDGTERWVHLSVMVVCDAGGRPSHLIAHIDDITDRKREVAELEERFRELADNISVGFTLHQLEPTTLLYVNPAYYDIFGLDRNGPVPTVEDALARFHADDRAVAEEAVAALGRLRAVSVELRVVRPDGELRWVRCRLNPVGAEFGVVPRIAGLYEDVTDQRATDAALVESQTRFNQLANNTDVGFFLRDINGMIYVNAGFRRIFGEDESLDISAENLLTFVPENDRRRAAKIATMFQQGRPTRTELTIVRRDGSVRWVRVVDDPVFDDDGVAIRAAGTVEDITDRKLAEETVQAARIEAERANAAKDGFLSRMSHELRTPLNAVLGFAQLLELDELSPSQRDAVAHILHGGRHLLSMIDDVLDITSVEADRIVPALVAVDLVPVVGEVVDLTQPLADSLGVELRVDDSLPAALYARVDRQRLRQVLLNLVSNAVNYNRPGGRAAIAIAAASDAEVCVSVSDTGPGLTSDEISRLFQPFERLGHHSSDIEGTGIGLALSQRLVTLMGGRIDVRSMPGTGSTFTVTLPAAGPDLTATGVAPEGSGGTPEPVPAVSSVLYIEDSPSNVELMTGILRRRPTWTLTHAVTGRHGLELASALAPTVILLDLHLPDVDGVEVLKALRADPSTAAVPVAVLSADAGPAQVRRLLAAGAEIYLTKPLDVQQVLAFLDAHAR